MKFLILILSTMLLSCTQDKEPKVRKPSSVDPSKYINMLPTQSMRDAAQEYAFMVGLDHYKNRSFGASNRGLAIFNWDLMEKNKCFKKLVANFYTDVAKHSAFYSRNLPQRENYLFNNLSISTENTSPKAGWIWKLAKDKAGGDANLAMTLIGICGHDNTEQLPKEMVCEDKKGKDGLVSECESIRKYIPFSDKHQMDQYLLYVKEAYFNYLKKWNPTTSKEKELKKKLEGDKELIEEIMGSADKGMVCPGNVSPFFLQGALGQETLLPDELVKKITEIQAPTMGSAYLPSKYYHVIGASYAVCSLVRNGVPSFIAKRIQKVGINTYRMFRLCGQLGDKEYKTPIPKLKFEEFLKLAREFKENPRVCIEEFGKAELDWDDNFNINKPGCFAISKLRGVIEDSNIDKNILESKYDRYVGEIGASYLFKGEVLGNSECKEVQLTDSKVDKMREVSDSEIVCEGFSEKMCQKAKEVLKTWWIDFKWSEGQHLKGAEFAINNCEKEDNFLSQGLEKKSCEALKPKNYRGQGVNRSEGIQ